MAFLHPEGKETTALIDMKQTLPIATKSKKSKPSGKEPPKLEMKSLPNFMKYIILGQVETLSYIITTDLSAKQEEQLLAVLKNTS